jgi:hypothetical protein
VRAQYGADAPVGTIMHAQIGACPNRDRARWYTHCDPYCPRFARVVLRDSIETGRMASGLILAPEASGMHVVAITEWERLLAATLRAEHFALRTEPS